MENVLSKILEEFWRNSLWIFHIAIIGLSTKLDFNSLYLFPECLVPSLSFHSSILSPKILTLAFPGNFHCLPQVQEKDFLFSLWFS